MVDDVPAEEEIVDDIQEPELEDSPEEYDDIGEFESEEMSESTEESPSEDQMMDAALGMMTGQPVDVTPISPPGMPPMGPPPETSPEPEMEMILPPEEDADEAIPQTDSSVPVVEHELADPRDDVEVEIEELESLSPLRTPLREEELEVEPEPEELIDMSPAAEPGQSKILGHIVPHTHWDRAWYLPFQQYRYKLVELVDDLLELMEDNPEAFPSFELDGQTVVLEDYLEVRPENRQRLVDLVEAGRLSIGPWYVLPDEYLVGGEALIRNLQLGASSASEFGGRSEVGYVPDPFGHVNQLPAILRGCGLDSFIFTRGAGPWVAEDARGVFYWQAADGETEVLSIKQVPDYPNLMAWGFEKRPLDRKDSPKVNIDTAMEKMQNLLDMHKSKYNWRPDQMLFGQGSDHTHPQTALPRLIDAANERFGAQAQFKHSSFSEFVTEMKKWIGRKKIHRYSGELHDGWDRNVLSGVFSSRMYLKRLNDQTMRVLTDQVEPLSAMTNSWERRNRSASLALAWREVLRSHPHDDICGCSVDSVHSDDEVRFRHAQEISAMLMDDVRDDLIDGMNLHHVDRDAVPILLHNPLPVPWSGTLPVDIALPAYRCYLESSTRVKIVLSKPAPGCSLHGMIGITEPLFGMHMHPDRAINVELPRLMGQVIIHELPPGVHVAHVLPGAETISLPDRPVEIGGTDENIKWISNGHIRIDFRRDGRFDVTHSASKKTLSGIGRLEDSEDAGDSYDWSPGGWPVEVGMGKGEPLKKRATEVDRRLSDQEDGELRTVSVSIQTEDAWASTVRLNVVWALPTHFDDDAQQRSDELDWLTVDHYITLRTGSEVIEVETWMDNNCRDHRLRLCIPSGLNVRKVHAGGAFDVISRNASWPHDPDWEQPHVQTQHFSQFVALQDRISGIALLCPGSNEYEAVANDDGDGLDLRLTMLRSTGWLSRDGFATRRNQGK